MRLEKDCGLVFVGDVRCSWGRETDLGGSGGHEVAGDEACSVCSQEASFGHASE